jgi:hypothetical protein
MILILNNSEQLHMLKPIAKQGAKRFSRLLFSAAIALLLDSNIAFAQAIGALEPDDVAGNRVQPEYDSLGISLGSVTLKPTLAVTPVFNSNVFAAQSAKQSDATLSVTPALSASLKKQGQAISIYAEMKVRRNIQFNDQNDEQYRIEANVFRELPSSMTVAANFGWAETTAARGTFENDLQIGGPIKQHDFRTQFALSKRFNRVSIDGSVNVSRFTFGDVDLGSGGTVDQSFRNGRRVGGKFGISYELSPLMAIRINSSHDVYDYHETRPLLDRDAKAYSATLGVRYEVTRLLTAQFDAGLRAYKFKNPLYSNIHGLALSARFRWYPTQLVSVRIDLGQSTTTSAFDSVSAVTVTDFKLACDYEYRRNIVLTGEAQVTLEEYGGLGANAKRVALVTRANWKLARWLSMSGYASFNTRMRSGFALIPAYTAVQTGVGFRFAL